MSLQIFSNTNPMVVGIDPGDKNTGVAIWDNHEMLFVDLFTKTFWDCVSWMNSFKQGRETNSKGIVKNVVFFIENPALNKPVFPMGNETDLFEKALEKQDKELQKKAIGMFSRRAQNIGMNKQLSLILIEIAKMKGYQVKEVRPSKKKLSAQEFNAKTGYSGRSSQHARDAARLVYPF